MIILGLINKLVFSFIAIGNAGRFYAAHRTCDQLIKKYNGKLGAARSCIDTEMTVSSPTLLIACQKSIVNCNESYESYNNEIGKILSEIPEILKTNDFVDFKDLKDKMQTIKSLHERTLLNINDVIKHLSH